MTSKTDSFDAFGEDDDFFMNEVYDDERDRSNSLVYVEEDLQEKNNLLAKEDAGRSPPSLQPGSDSDSDSQDSESESDEDILIIGESNVTVTPIDSKPLPRRRLRSQKSGQIIPENSRRSVPLLPLTRSKRQKLAGSKKQSRSTVNENSAKAVSRNPNSRSAAAPHGKDYTPQKVYNVKLLSRLNGSFGKVIQVKVSGQDEFTSILESVLDGIVEEEETSEQLRKQYSAESVTLYWNNAKLLKFMTCDSLRVDKTSEDEVIDVDITMIHSGREQEYEQQLRSRIMRVGDVSATEGDEDSEARDEEIGVLETKTSEKAIEKKAIPDDLDIEANSNTIKVALVGQDNRKLYVQVRSSTPFSKVAEYYKTQKSISKEVPIKLIFDHEELDLGGTIGEQDMEDEDMIEVLI